jgi:hypothetical protein
MIANYINTACINYTHNLLLNFTNKLSKSLNVEQQSLLDIWNKDNSDLQVQVDNNLTKSSSSVDKKVKKQCEYVNKRGEAKRCTGNVSEKSKTGLYCCRHAKVQENEDKKEKETTTDEKSDEKIEEKKTKPKPKSPPKKNKDDTQSKTDETKEKFKFRLKLNKNHNIYYDEKSSYVFDKQSKKIYAKFINDKVVALTQEDIDFFKKYSMEYDDELHSKLYPEQEPGEQENEQEESEDQQENEQDETEEQENYN